MAVWRARFHLIFVVLAGTTRVSVCVCVCCLPVCVQEMVGEHFQNTNIAYLNGSNEFEVIYFFLFDPVVYCVCCTGECVA